MELDFWRRGSILLPSSLRLTGGGRRGLFRLFVWDVMKSKGTSARGAHGDLGIRTSNNAEAAVCRRLENDGWEVLKRGWPDFLAFRDGEIRLIEVKPGKNPRLSPKQKRVAEILQLAGLHVEVVSPDSLLTERRGKEIIYDPITDTHFERIPTADGRGDISFVKLDDV